jgi:glutaconate CoA-transferase, subunit B
MPDSNYTPAELMVAAAAREIRDGEVVFVGMRLPLLAFSLAKETHAPRAIGLFENGIIRDFPAIAPIVTMCDPPNVTQSIMCADMMEIMGTLQKGLVDVGFIGGAQVDRFGNLNTTWVGPEGSRKVRLPGSGGGADIASLSKRLLIIMAHERRRFVEKVDYVTSPGYGEGGAWREQVGLIRGGPGAVITTLGILRFDEESREAFLDSVHPGVEVDRVKEQTGWDLKVSPSVSRTRPPSGKELEIIRAHDPRGFWTR